MYGSGYSIRHAVLSDAADLAALDAALIRPHIYLDLLMMKFAHGFSRPHIYLDLLRMKFAHGFSVFRQSSLCFVRYLVMSWVLSTLGTWVWVYA